MSAGFADLVRNAGRMTGWWDDRSTGCSRPDQMLADTVSHGEPCPEFQLLLEDRLRDIESAPACADAACALIASRLGAGQVLLAEIDPTGRPGMVRGAWPKKDPSNTTLPLTSLGDVLHARLADGQCVQSAELELVPRIADMVVQAAWRDRNVASFAAAPIMCDGRLAALILAAQDQPRRWDDPELALVRRAGERSWTAFGRARVLADLRRSEYEHRMAIKLSAQTFWAAAPDGRLDDAGPIFGQLSARRPDQRDMGWRQTTHPLDLPAMERAVAHCLATGEDYDIEHRTLGIDGRPRWVHVCARPARGPDGRIERWFGSITDIDRRKRVEAALKASEDRFARAIAGARVGTWDWDMGTDEVATSPGFEPQFHDLPEGSIRSSRDFLNAIHPEDRERMAAVLAEVVDRARRHGSAEYEAEYRIIRSDGEVRWLGSQGNVTASPGEGHGGFLSGLTVDMSERRRAEALLTATQERLHSLNADLEAQVRREVEMREHAQSLLAQSRRMEALGQLAGGIAHDFNNVLQAVVGGLDLLQRRADRPDLVRQLAARTAEAAARGTAITGRLLAFARRGDLQTQEVEALPLLSGLRDMLAPTLGVGIALQVAAARDLPPLLADRAQLETVLVNLAVNARDAMPDGGTLAIDAQAVRISRGALPQPELPACLAVGDYIRFAVSDDGAGMTEETLARASEPFFTTKAVGEGTGLGLAMARGFAEQSGGGFALSSVLGQGTTIWLWFPSRREDGPADQTAPRHSEFGIPPCVLVVDDDHLVRSMLASVIEEMGCTVIQASSGTEALAQLDAAGRVDLVVSDYAMPGMNGSALAALIRQTRPTLPILMVTGYIEDSLGVDTVAWESPITMLVRKPISAPALSAAIATLLAGSRIDS